MKLDPARPQLGVFSLLHRQKLRVSTMMMTFFATLFFSRNDVALTHSWAMIRSRNHVWDRTRFQARSGGHRCPRHCSVSLMLCSRRMSMELVLQDDAAVVGVCSSESPRILANRCERCAMFGVSARFTFGEAL